MRGRGGTERSHDLLEHLYEIIGDIEMGGGGIWVRDSEKVWFVGRKRVVDVTEVMANTHTEKCSVSFTVNDIVRDIAMYGDDIAWIE